MKDIGLGILDVYTVVIVLVTLVLAQLLLGYPIPLDTTDATQLFISLALFTGYLYAARSLFRLPFAAIQAMMLVNDAWRVTDDFKSDEKGLKRIKPALKAWWGVIQHLPLLIGRWLLFFINFSNQGEKARTRAPLLIRYFFALLDRLSLILVTVLAVIPAYKGYFQSFAIAGLVLLLVLFVFRGNFSALLADSLEKAVDADERKEVESPEQLERAKMMWQQQAEAMMQMEEEAMKKPRVLTPKSPDDALDMEARI